MEMKKIAVAVLLTAGLLAGCQSNDADSSGKANTTSDTEAADIEKDAADSENKESMADRETEERTEIRREKYDDCDGSGHGYVEIYYSDGSMETEEY